MTIVIFCHKNGQNFYSGCTYLGFHGQCDTKDLFVSHWPRKVYRQLCCLGHFYYTLGQLNWTIIKLLLSLSRQNKLECLSQANIFWYIKPILSRNLTCSTWVGSFLTWRDKRSNLFSMRQCRRVLYHLPEIYFGCW